MAIKKTQLYSHLWEAANALRGGMDASQYKDYVLTLLFVKYVTDRYKNVPDSIFEVPQGGSFDDLIEAKGKKDIGERINKVLHRLAEANNLKGVIDHVDFDDSSKLGTGKEKVDRLTKLIAIFENPELNFAKNRADGDDILGDVYEYFMKKFATEAGKSKGQFYTPAEVSRIMAQIIGVENVTSRDQTAYDPTCGSGSLLLKVAAEAKDATGLDISLYGQEKDLDVANLARMNMMMHGFPDAEIQQGDTLANPKFLQDGKLKTFDFAVANPPFSLKNWMSGIDPQNDPYNRFEDGIPPAKNGDYAFLLHLIKSLKPNGKGAIILPHGVLFRGNAEAVIRRNLVKRGYIKGIIGLPPNLFYGTSIPAIILVIDKENASARKGIFMIDASRDFRKDGAKNRLRERDIHKIVTTFKNLTEIPGYSRMVSFDEIEKNDFNLNIPRYIQSIENQDKQDMYAHLYGGIPAVDVDQIKIFTVFPELKKQIFTRRDDGYYDLNTEIDQIQSLIYDSKQIQLFRQQILDIFNSWADEHKTLLENIDNQTRVKPLIKQLSESLLNAYKPTELIDEYAMYQVLLDWWEEQMKDDVYLIIEKGWTAKPYRIIEKNKKGKEVDKGWTCDLLAKDIVTNEFFISEKTEIDKLNEEVDNISSKIQELLDENSSEDSIFEEVKNEKGNIVKKELEKKIKELRQNPEFKEDVALLQNYLDLVTRQSQIKKQIKQLQKQLDTKLLEKYSQLTEAEVKDLVINKKWYAALRERISDELDNIILDFSARVKQLAERYQTPLPEIEVQVKELEDKVKSYIDLLLQTKN